MIVVMRVMNYQPLVPSIKKDATLKKICVLGRKTLMTSLTGQETTAVRCRGRQDQEEIIPQVSFNLKT